MSTAIGGPAVAARRPPSPGAPRLPDTHVLSAGLRRAFGWADEPGLGRGFARAEAALARPGELLAVERFLDLLLRRALEPPQLRCFQDSVELHPNEYLVRVTSRRRASQRMADPARLSQLLDEGVTVVLDALDVLDPHLEVACRALQWWFGEFAQVNAYLTTGATAGFPLHWDDHDVLVVQVAGSKHWDVRGPTRAAPMHRDAEPNLEPSTATVWEGSLRAGDAMHIPRGYWHSARRNDEGYSLHVTFGITQRTGADWLAWVGDRARAEADFRSDLAAGPSTGQLRHRAIELLATASPQAFLAQRRAVADPARFVHSTAITPHVDALVCVTPFAPHVEADGADGAFRVEASGRRLVFRSLARPVVERCVSGLPVQVGELAAAYGAKTVSAVATTLLEARICAPTTAEWPSAFIELT